MSKKMTYEQIGVAMTCRSYNEYVQMFELTEQQLKQGKVLDVAGGASSFTASVRKKGYFATAVDPLYHYTLDELTIHAEQEMEEAEKKVKQLQKNFCWDSYGSVSNHQEERRQSLSLFLESYLNERNQYKVGELPHLPFAEKQFSLTLCNHFLFLYESQFTKEFHIKAIAELIRVTASQGQVLIYPLVGFDGTRYPDLNELVELFTNEASTAELEDTAFRFIPTADQFLKITVR